VDPLEPDDPADPPPCIDAPVEDEDVLLLLVWCSSIRNKTSAADVTKPLLDVVQDVDVEEEETLLLLLLLLMLMMLL